MLKKSVRTKSSLFLMELILAILFFSLASAVCVQVFVKAHFTSQSAKELTLASSLTSSAANAVTGTDGTFSGISALFPDAKTAGDTIYLYYDESGSACTEEAASYILEIIQVRNDAFRDASLRFLNSKNTCIYELNTHLYQPDTV